MKSFRQVRRNSVESFFLSRENLSRLSNPLNWYHTNWQYKIADLSTHNGMKVEQVSSGSPWIDGLPWMREREEKFTLRAVEDIVLCTKEQTDLNEEKFVSDDLTPEDISAYKSVKERSDTDTSSFSTWLIHAGSGIKSSCVLLLWCFFS